MPKGGENLKLIDRNKINQPGRFIMIYGATGVGKTTSILQSALEPMIYIATEPRSLKPSLDAAGRESLDIDVAVYEDFNRLMEFVSDSVRFERYKTVVLDSYSHLMSIGLSVEIEDQAFEARSIREREVKPLVNRTKMSPEGFGGLASHMFRLTAALGRLSQAGKVVIVTALLSENPKWDRELAAAPALKGREFPINMPGFFDLIGLVEPRVDGDGKIVYPPLVRFQSPDGSFVSKFTGKNTTKTQGPLNITKILMLV